MESFIKLCRKNNLKITPQRSLIYKELVESREHPSAEALYKKVKKTFPTISFDTVYRTLLTFSKIGAANILTIPGEPKRFDGEIQKHYHFRCIKCDNIVNIYDGPSSIDIPESISKRFDVLDSKVIFEGICDKCKKIYDLDKNAKKGGNDE
jgi:Fur family peroxide stress response transcriptional regulator